MTARLLGGGGGWVDGLPALPVTRFLLANGLLAQSLGEGSECHVSEWQMSK